MVRDKLLKAFPFYLSWWGDKLSPEIQTEQRVDRFTKKIEMTSDPEEIYVT